MEYLGGVVGSASFLEKVIKKKVKIWSKEVEKLSFITDKTQPMQPLFICVSAKWTYFSPVIDFCCLLSGLQSFAPLENVIF